MIRAVMLKSHATKELEALGGESPRKFYLIPRRSDEDYCILVLFLGKSPPP